MPPAVANKPMNDWKDRLGVVFSTNPDFQYATSREEEPETLPPGKQRLVVGIDRRNRGGKQVTLVSGFVGKADDLKELGRQLKTKLGVGGSAKDGEIAIQGDFRDKVVDLLKSLGYNAKRGN
ncbi:MAG: translation initiation factor [Bacteroidales bacterium]|nr:translation initiation factor [Bacteroidales bacterium]